MNKEIENLKKLVQNGQYRAKQTANELNSRTHPSLYGFFDGQVEAYDIVLNLIEKIK